MKKFTIAVFICISSAAFAQPFFDVANVYYLQSPDNSLYHSDDYPVKTTLFSANLNAAFKSKEDYFIINPFCDAYQFESPETEKQKLYGMGMSLTWLKQWKNKKWQTAFVAIPRLNSDLKKIDGNDYQAGGAVLAIYKKKETLSYKFGAYYNSEFFGPLILPLLGIEWKASERLNIFGVLPQNLVAEYKFNEHLYGGCAFDLILNSYRFEDDSFFRLDENRMKLFADIYLTKNVVLNLEAGQTFLRKYRKGIREDGVTTYSDVQVNDGLVFKAGLTYRMRMDQKIEPDNSAK
jgi:hypothetical protein